MQNNYTNFKFLNEDLEKRYRKVVLRIIEGFFYHTGLYCTHVYSESTIPYHTYICIDFSLLNNLLCYLLVAARLIRIKFGSTGTFILFKSLPKKPHHENTLKIAQQPLFCKSKLHE